MEIGSMLLTDILPEGFVQEKIQAPGYFLEQLCQTEGIRIIRIICVAVFVVILLGSCYYGKKASKDMENGKEEN